jgi:hypothetical protein
VYVTKWPKMASNVATICTIFCTETILCYRFPSSSIFPLGRETMSISSTVVIVLLRVSVDCLGLYVNTQNGRFSSPVSNSKFTLPPNFDICFIDNDGRVCIKSGK